MADKRVILVIEDEHAISNFIESYESTDALTILRDEFRLTDDEIREMGLDYLFDLAEQECENISYDSMECMDYSLELLGPQE